MVNKGIKKHDISLLFFKFNLIEKAILHCEGWPFQNKPISSFYFKVGPSTYVNSGLGPDLVHLKVIT